MCDDLDLGSTVSGYGKGVVLKAGSGGSIHILFSSQYHIMGRAYIVNDA